MMTRFIIVIKLVVRQFDVQLMLGAPLVWRLTATEIDASAPNTRFRYKQSRRTQIRNENQIIYPKKS